MKYRLIGTLSIILLLFIALSEFPDPASANADKFVRAGPRLSTTDVPGLRFPILPLQWLTVVNNSVAVPGTSETFASYGQPSVNTHGVVVFRGRSTGSSERQSGVYKRRNLTSPIEDVVDKDFLVPYPNNLDAKFTEFPSIPRISPNAENIATIGNHKPVYRYVLPTGEETRVGTTGIYAQLESDLLITAASKLGAVPGFGYYCVPETETAVPFSVFPGSPAINDAGTIVFKGNYSVDGTERTGIFYRGVLNTPGGGNDEVKMITASGKNIPNLPPHLTFKKISFGSTAPPTVVGDDVVFTGLDNEDAPRYGGIYLASLTPSRVEAGHPLRAIAQVGNQAWLGNSFSWVGESLSFDGRYLAFWGARGNAMKSIRLYCPIDGNADLIAYCNGEDPNSIFDPETERWYQMKQVPVDQGIFLYDRLGDSTVQISSSLTDFNDYLFWVYSGKAPGTGGGDEDAEPPRWRASAFMSVYDGIVAFKARTATLDPNGNYQDIVDGIYVKMPAPGRPIPGTGLQTVMETGMDGSLLDPVLQPGEMLISGVGIEREGLRGRHLAITVSMENAEAGWGGIYMADVTMPQPDSLQRAATK